jgi:membrane protease YdiL (CAAX protease family)
MLEPDPYPDASLAQEPPVRKRRNDSISPIAVLALLVFWALQNSFITLPFVTGRHAGIARRSSATDTGTGMSSDVETGILDIDLQAKSSYLTSGVSQSAPHSGLPGALAANLSQASAKSRKAALSEALDLFAKNSTDVLLARRVILLRAETGSPNPLGPVTCAPPHPHGKPTFVSPLAPFDPRSGASASMAAEGAVWQALFGSRAMITAEQAGALAVRIRSIDNLRWWAHLALHQLYTRAGEPVGAARALAEAGSEADVSVALSSVLSVLTCLCLLVGVIAVVVLAMRAATAVQGVSFDNTDNATLFPDNLQASANGEGIRPASTGSIFDETSARIQDSDRKLGAGDLANLFALYLFLMMAVEGVAPYLIRQVVGAGFMAAAPETTQVTILIAAYSIVTAFCGGVTVAALLWLARRRGASVADEIGLNAGGAPLWRVVLFGLLGWCISLPLLIGISFIAKVVFHNAPSPANPAIPLLMATPGGLAAVALYILVAVFAPFFEETVFRGLFYNAARLRIGVRPAIVVTGLAFGLSHSVGIAEQIPLAVLGGVLAWLAQTRKSLLPGMVAHCLQNSFAYALLLFTLLSILPRFP